MAPSRKKNPAKQRRPLSVVPAQEQEAPTPRSFPIVGVGASAGGLEAFTDLLHALPDKPGMAFVLIQHQDRDHVSHLSEILSRATSMKVEAVHETTPIEPNCVYVAAPDTELSIEDGNLIVRARPSGKTMPVDVFFKSLAEDRGRQAIGIVLSGTQDDGTRGSQAVKAEGGTIFAQDESAKFTGMPQSAAAGGAVDYVMSPSGIARELSRISDSSAVEDLALLGQPELAQIFEMLAKTYHVDFGYYKPTTIERRIRRRMAARRCRSLQRYLDVLRSDTSELGQLYAELLIQVTGFFRDPDVFAAIETSAAPDLMRQHHDSGDPVRIWVPGCSTGEEVYSLAIIMLEAAAAANFGCPLQVFGTDISEEAIDQARAGVYSAEAMLNVSKERLERYFTRSGAVYRIAKSVRDCCVFARQNVTRDPPFSRLDLISCRNVLIYLGPILQRKVMHVFHYALRPSGYLVLGSAETIANFGELFEPYDRRHKIYRKQGTRPKAVHFAAPIRPVANATSETPLLMQQDAPGGSNIFREADRVVISRYAPAGVVIDDQMEILQFRGRTSPFLEPAPGSATFNLLKMLRDGLLADVRAAVQTAKKSGAVVRRDGVRLKRDDETVTIDVEVLPFLSPSNERHCVVLFQEKQPSAAVAKKNRKKKAEEPEDPRQVVRFKRELDATREYLQSIIEEQEAMNEELRSANEEIQSSNEELQSTNEELETAKEELQSTNEELMTLNEELETRNVELTTVNNDLVNVLASVEIPIVMVDSTQRIRRFNPSAQRAFNLVSGDVGRSINDLKSTLVIDDLEPVIREVVETLKMREIAVNDREGRPHVLRVRPYRTLDNRIEGAVLALLEGPKT